MKLLLGLLALAATSYSLHSNYFEPAHRLTGIGADRREISTEILEARTLRMIESETFAIMRDPEATAGARRILSPRLQKLFRSAAQSSGFPEGILEAICYLESWGNPRAESPAGPKGIMQFSEGTARAAGLRVVRVTRYRYSTERVQVRNKRGKLVTRKVRRKTPYVVTVRDDRLSPERAIPGAARYLARMVNKFGGLDWAVFAYHCGEGCVAELQPLARNAIKSDQPFTVAAMFFAASPAYHRDLYEALSFHMQRDYSPTYWFRVMRAGQLLKLYETNRAEFDRLVAEYRNDADPAHRADYRLVVWLKGADLLYRNYDDLRRASGTSLVKVFNNPDYFGFTLPRPAGDPVNYELYGQASPSAVGTLIYIAYETRRLFNAVQPKGETFVPLEVTELVNTVDQERRREPGTAIPLHCTGQVFDISTANLPHGERECLNFILDEMGWDGYLGFRLLSGDTVHIGCSPSSRDFFTQIYQDAMSKAS